MADNNAVSFTDVINWLKSAGNADLNAGGMTRWSIVCVLVSPSDAPASFCPGSIPISAPLTISEINAPEFNAITPIPTIVLLMSTPNNFGITKYP